MNEAAHTISLISPSKYWKSSSTFNTSNSDPTSYILRCCKWAWNSFCEWNGTRPFGPACRYPFGTKKFSNLSPEILGWMDCVHHTFYSTQKKKQVKFEKVLWSTFRLKKMKISILEKFHSTVISIIIHCIHDQHSDWPRVPCLFWEFTWFYGQAWL